MKILVAIEDEVFGDAIAKFLATHEWPDDSEIKLIHVTEPIFVHALSGYPSELIRSVNEERERAAKSMLLAIGTQLTQCFPRVSTKEEVLFGHPKDVILDAAKDWPADLIVMGSHGRSGFGRFMLGSVSMSILSAAPCSLVVVKLPQETKRGKPAESKEAVKI